MIKPNTKKFNPEALGMTNLATIPSIACATIGVTGETGSSKTTFGLSTPGPDIVYFGLDNSMETIREKYDKGGEFYREGVTIHGNVDEYFVPDMYAMDPKKIRKQVTKDVTGKEIKPEERTKIIADIKEAALPAWNKFQSDYYAAMNAAPRSCVIDTWDQIYQMCRLSLLGRESTDPMIGGALVTPPMKSLLKKAMESETNVIFLIHDRDEYVPDPSKPGDKKASIRSGRRARQACGNYTAEELPILISTFKIKGNEPKNPPLGGLPQERVKCGMYVTEMAGPSYEIGTEIEFEKDGFFPDVLRSGELKEDLGFRIQFEKCRPNTRLEGKIAPPWVYDFPTLMVTIYPGTEISQWE